MLLQHVLLPDRLQLLCRRLPEQRPQLLAAGPQLQLRGPAAPRHVLRPHAAAAEELVAQQAGGGHEVRSLVADHAQVHERELQHVLDELSEEALKEASSMPFRG